MILFTPLYKNKQNERNNPMETTMLHGYLYLDRFIWEWQENKTDYDQLQGLLMGSLLITDLFRLRRAPL